MYYQEVNDNIVKYYAFGYIVPDGHYDDRNSYFDNRIESYFIIYLDSKNLTFYVEPYDGSIFTGGESNE